jgi:hypothetical protein
MDKMLGRKCPTGPGGRDCNCCGQAPGVARKVAKRNIKRSERNTWKKDIRLN